MRNRLALLERFHISHTGFSCRLGRQVQVGRQVHPGSIRR